MHDWEAIWREVGTRALKGYVSQLWWCCWQLGAGGWVLWWQKTFVFLRYTQSCCVTLSNQLIPTKQDGKQVAENSSAVGRCISPWPWHFRPFHLWTGGHMPASGKWRGGSMGKGSPGCWTSTPVLGQKGVFSKQTLNPNLQFLGCPETGLETVKPLNVKL